MDLLLFKLELLRARAVFLYRLLIYLALKVYILLSDRLAEVISSLELREPIHSTFSLDSIHL